VRSPTRQPFSLWQISAPAMAAELGFGYMFPLAAAQAPQPQARQGAPANPTCQARYISCCCCRRYDFPVQVQDGANSLSSCNPDQGAGVCQGVAQALELTHQHLILLLCGRLWVLHSTSMALCTQDKSRL
jgi:hypothetical protein